MMSNSIVFPLKSSLANAYQVVGTYVLRTTDGIVFTIDVGENLLDEQRPRFGAKITLQGKALSHVGVAEGSSADEALEAAQQLVLSAIQKGVHKQSSAKPSYVSPVSKSA